jgi:hypothetical protein
MVSRYAPTSGQDDEFLECIDHLSEFLLLNLSESEYIVIGADTNCSMKSSTRRKQAWKAFCETFSLEEKSGAEDTFHHHNGTSNSRIDMFAVSKSLQLSQVVQLCTLEYPLNLSSHDVLTSSLAVPACDSKKSLYEHTCGEFKREKVIWSQDKVPEFQALAAKALKEAEEYWSSPEFIPLLCSMYSNLLGTSAKLVFDVKKAGAKPSKQTKCKKVKSAETFSQEV